MFPEVGNIWKSKISGKKVELIEINERSAFYRAKNGRKVAIPLWDLVAGGYWEKVDT